MVVWTYLHNERKNRGFVGLLRDYAKIFSNFSFTQGIPNFKYVTSLQILKFEIRINLSFDS